MDKKIVIDVGAAKGEFSRHVLLSYPNAVVFAVEPNISLHGNDLNMIKSEYDGRFFVHKYALAEKSNTRPMYGLTQLKGQIGSLKKFNPNKVWNTYIESIIDKSKLSEIVYVEVKSVNDFLRDIAIFKIDFLKIDTQGYDVVILEEFLKNSSVKCMVVEVNTVSNKSENIYEGDNNLTALSKIISKFDLKILKIVPNWDFSELNVFLALSEIEGIKILQQLKIDNNPVFVKGWNVSITSKLSEISAQNKLKKLAISFNRSFGCLKKLYLLMLKLFARVKN